MRLMMLAGFSFLACFLVAPFLSFSVLLVLCAFFIVSFALACIIMDKSKYKNIICICFFCMMAFCIYTLNLYIKPMQTEKYVDKECVVSGRIIDGPKEASGIFLYTLEAYKIENEEFGFPRKTKISLYTTDEVEFEKYDNVELKVRLSKVDNTLSFNGQYYNFSKGIYLRANLLESIKSEKGKPNFYESITDSISGFIKEKITTNIPGEAGALILGIVAGDKSQISDDVNYSFTVSGYSHMLNVSGMHMSIVASFVFSLLMFISRNRRKISAVVCMVVVLIYIGVTGFSVSALRAGIMLMIYYLGILLDKDADSLNSLGAAVFIILLINPFTALDVGFLLSTFSTLGIIICGKMMNNHLNNYGQKRDFPIEKRKLLSSWINLTVPSFSATLFSLPVNLIFFYRVYLISPISNVFASLIVTFIVILGIVFLLVALTGLPFLVSIFSVVLEFLGNALIFLSSFFAKAKNISIPTGDEGIKVAAFLVFAVLILSFFVKKFKTRVIAVIVGSVCSIVFSVGGYAFVNRDNVETYIFSSEYSTAAVIIDDNLVYLYGCGDENTSELVSNFLFSKGKTEVSYMILPSVRAKDISGYENLVIDIKVNNIIYPKTEDGIADHIYIPEGTKAIELKNSSITTSGELTLNLFDDGSMNVVVGNTNYLFLKGDDISNKNTSLKYDILFLESSKQIDLSKMKFNYLVNRKPLDFSKYMNDTQLISLRSDSVLKIYTKGNNDIIFKEETSNGIDLRL